MSMQQPTSSARPSLQDATQNLNIPPPPPSKRRRSPSKLSSRATVKAIYHHIEVAENQADGFSSPPCKHTARKSALKATLKTAFDFSANSILDSQIDSQQWYNNLITPDTEVKAEESLEHLEAEESDDACTNCAHLLAQLEHSHTAHWKTCNDRIKLTRDYDSLVKEAKFLRESMLFAAVKITEMAGGMSGTLGKLLDPDSE